MSNEDFGYDPGDYNKSGFIIFVISFASSILLFIWLGYLHEGIDFKEVKQKAAVMKGEVAVDKNAFDVSKVKKPWLSTDEMITHGSSVYKINCASCHGPIGKGDGPASSGINPRNLVEGAWVKGGKSTELYTTLTNGVAGTSMAAFAFIKPASRWALVHYVRSITENKVEDDIAALEAFAQEQ